MSNMEGDHDIGGADEFTDRRARILKKLAEKQLEKVNSFFLVSLRVFVIIAYFVIFH